MTEKTTQSWYANIWIGGDHREAVQACRRFCMESRVRLINRQRASVAGLRLV